MSFYQSCNDVGKYVNTTETNYYCENITVTPKDYNTLKKNKTCSKNDTPVDICICPKNYNGIYCQNIYQTVCKFDTVSINILIN